jgi:ABC-type dipeptide/oligopeptide/nickel transport system permease component
METLVATVLIVIVFMVSSLILNNMLSGNIQQNTELAEERLHALEYQYKNKGIKLPYYEDFESWEISITKQQLGNKMLVLMEAENPTTNKIVTNYITDEN